MLLIKIDETLPAVPDPEVEWVQREASGRETDRGRARLSTLPATVPISLVAAAGAVGLHPVHLPKVPEREVERMLPYALEEAVLCDPAEIIAGCGPATANGLRMAAVVQRRWLEAWLEIIEARLGPVQAVWPESLMLPLAAGEWSVVHDGRRGVVRTGDNAAFILDAAADAPPHALQRALAEARGAGRPPQQLRVYGTGIALEHWEAALALPVKSAPPWDWRGATDLPVMVIWRASRLLSSPSGVRRAALALLALLLLETAANAAGYARLVLLEHRLAQQTRLVLERLKLPSQNVHNGADLERQLAPLAGSVATRQLRQWTLALARGLAAGGNVEVRALQFSPGQLEVSLNAAAPAAVNQLRDQLTAQGLAAEVRAASQGKGGGQMALVIHEPTGERHGS